MENLKIFIKESISNLLNEDQTILRKMYGWYSSFKNRYYTSVDSAVDDIKHVVDHNNKQFSKVFGEDNPNEIVNLFNFVETKKGVRVVPKLKQKKEKIIVLYPTNLQNV